jgi:DNA-binding transcriptional LysR family regulator
VQVRKLSETLGLKLLEQTGRKIVLTEAGKEVYETGPGAVPLLH